MTQRILYIVAIVASISPIAAHADTAFTYQGELRQNGGLADGPFNMDFALWDAASGGSQVGETIMIDGVQVTEGRFTVELDFGAESFDNSGRWLEIEVAGDTLLPRQPLTPTPYAIYSIQTRGVFVDDAGNIGIGTTSPEFPLDVLHNEVGGAAVRGVNTAVSGVAIHGRSPTDGLGVQGISEGPAGVGVSGTALSDSGKNAGVVGSSFSSDGYDFYAGGAGIDYGALSSRRWKQNIEPIARPLEKVARLRGVSFEWDATHGGHHDVGMIAEEVGAVLPEIVVYEENGVDAQGMDYSKLTPLLVEAVNALRAEKDAELDALREENAVLRARIEHLEAAIDDIALAVDR